MKLKDKLKPEVYAALDNAKYEYSSSHRSIFASLSSVEDYRDLTMKELMNIYTFLPQEFKPTTDIGWLYGDNILAKKYRL
tara:strand:- start:263 stop:502 length:240 start_codon:yes stop_codon:yes gene_type:complete